MTNSFNFAVSLYGKNDAINVKNVSFEDLKSTIVSIISSFIPDQKISEIKVDKSRTLNDFINDFKVDADAEIELIDAASFKDIIVINEENEKLSLKEFSNTICVESFNH